MSKRAADSLSVGAGIVASRMAFLPVPNEYVLLTSGIALIFLVAWEYYDTQVLLTFGNGRQEKRLHGIEPSKTDTAAVVRSPSPQKEVTFDEASVSDVATAPVTQTEDGTAIDSDHDEPDYEAEAEIRSSRYRERISVSESLANLAPTSQSVEEVEEMVKKIMDPLPTGCEPFGPNADFMAEKFPQLTRPDIVRFLVARKGVVAAASEMAEKCLQWRATVFPLKKEDIRAAIMTGCFFPYKTARDGTPCVYMRGGLYDNTKATPEQFVLAAAYAIEYSLKTHPDQINVTVVVDTVIIPGAPNLGADMTFIKLFVKALSDNYPERLKRIVMYPFPWYGRAIWSVVKVFIDKRTQDKALLIGDTGKREVPPELAKYVDPDNIPVCCAGNCKEPILDLLSTLK